MGDFNGPDPMRNGKSRGEKLSDSCRRERREFSGFVFQDSDLYKWIEAVGDILQYGRDEDLEQKADEIIGYIVSAQQEDGYLNTYYQLKEPDRKWTNLLECHELYCAGHLIEAAVAYHKGTGKDGLLKAACRLADCVDRTFGPEEGKLHGYPGHPGDRTGAVKAVRCYRRRTVFELVFLFSGSAWKQPVFRGRV